MSSSRPSPQPHQLRNHDIDNRDIHNHTVPRPSNPMRMRLTNPFTRVFILVLALLSPALSHTHSVPLTISIPSSPQLPNPAALAASTLATLTTLSATQTAHLTTSHAFRFRNVSAPGSYLLSIACATHFFPPLRVDVGADGAVQAWRTFRGTEWANKGEEVPVVRNALEVRALGSKAYYMERQGFSPLSLLKNPMILIAGFGMLMVFGMPYLLENMDPEMRAEFEERQKSSPANALMPGAQQGNPLGSFDAAAWLAGSGKKIEGDGDDKAVEKGIKR